MKREEKSTIKPRKKTLRLDSCGLSNLASKLTCGTIDHRYIEITKPKRVEPF